jgi:hypothetical protein
MYTEDFCNNGNMPSNLQQNNIPNLTGAPWNITNVVPSGPGNITRYGMSGAGQSINTNGTRWCTGDQNAGGGGGNLNNTSYIVRIPDSTPWNDTDNPIASCAPAYFRGINQPMQTLLDPTNAAPDAVYVKNYFHRWATVCSIPAANVVLGDYIVQVKTNSSRASLSAPGGTFQTWSNTSDAETTDNSITDAGYNRYSMRAGFGTSSGVTGQRPDGTGVSISATTNLPIYANAGSDTTPTFYLARITPTAGSGRTLTLNLYDLGDVGNGSVDVHIVPPADATVGFSSCTISVDNGSPATFTSGNCTITGMTSAVYNGRLVTATIPIPSTYSCDFASATGCWVTIQMTYSGGAQPNDTTTWSATLNGDPVRLVE